MTIPEAIARWPGKSPADPGGTEHPAVYHMLDVAAVAERLAAPLPFEAALKDALILLAALHDLGKVNEAFRSMLRSGQIQTAGRHWEVTEALLLHHDAMLAATLGSRDTRRRLLYAATAGHHGRPPVKDEGLDPWAWKAMLTAAGPQAVADAAAVIAAFLDLWPGASLEGLAGLDAAKALSWRLAGLVTAADWIGSNADWFPAVPPGPSAADYLADARTRAAQAVARAGILAPPATGATLYDLTLRPMQAACASTPLPEGPMLALIEDETGAGKTEAALILAQRMMVAGKGSGLYVALPTMATADAMFARIATVLPRLFDGAPSLALAHGRGALSDRYRDLALARDRNPDDPGPTPWLLDSRRRALLAAVGVGTVDQALLAVVRAKHAALRQFGLASKILIVDEVHEMGDPYMGELLAALLGAHAAQGGSAILMSATLDLPLRGRLVAAFEAAAGRTTAAPGDHAYPALTVPGVASPAVPSRPSARGPVGVCRLDALGPALDLLAEAAQGGAACVLIRNAVDEAIAAVRALRDRGVEADLLHARFALCDRKRHEAAALAAFGKDRAGLPGRVLVATQVVEASLDLDFDVMVSDLAPMAALIQRAGRLWRHMDRRPAATRPVAAPILHVIAPDPGEVAGEAWAQEALGQGAHVYAVPLLWRTARALFEAGRIEAPEGLRALIAAAHGDAADVPGPLLRAELRAEGARCAARAHAAQNAIDWAAGYRAGAAGAGDADYPTRLGHPTRALVLMRDGAPWSGGGWSVDSCQLSEVSAAARRLDRVPIAPADPPPGLPDWLTATRSFVAVGEGGAICEGLLYNEEDGLLISSPNDRG
jgi:CRISPR-associated endonuclease/helicase Cas3